MRNHQHWATPDENKKPMKNSTQLAKRFRGVILDGKIVAFTNYKDQLSEVNWQQATQKIGSLNTLAALTFHVNYYIEGVNHFFENGKLEIRDKFSFDMLPITSEEEWKALRSRLFTNAETFAKHVESFSDEQLAATFVKEDYGTYQSNINVMIEHCYYHLGQVSLIKKMILEQ